MENFIACIFFLIMILFIQTYKVILNDETIEIRSLFQNTKTSNVLLFGIIGVVFSRILKSIFLINREHLLGETSLRYDEILGRKKHSKFVILVSKNPKQKEIRIGKIVKDKVFNDWLETIPVIGK